MMTREFLAVAAVAAVLLSCSKETVPVTPEEPQPHALVYEARIQDMATKTSLYGTSDIHWYSGDKIWVRVDDIYEQFTLSGAGGSASGTFVYAGAGSAIDASTTAFYGPSSVTSSTTVVLPSTYTWSSQGIQAPMADASGNGTFSLMGGVIKVEIENIPSDACKLVFTDPDHQLSGSYTVANYDGTGTIQAHSVEGDNTITITFEAGTATARTFFIPVPVGTLGNSGTGSRCTLRLFNSSDTKLFGKKLPVTTVAKNDIVYMPALTAASYSNFSSATISKELPHDLAQWDSIDVSNFTWLSSFEGMTLRISFTQTTADYHQLCLYALLTGSWTQSSIFEYVDVSALTSYDVTLTSAILTNLMDQNAFRIAGKGIEITGIELIPSSPETVLWVGEETLDWNSRVLFQSFNLSGIDDTNAITVYFNTAGDAGYKQFMITNIAGDSDILNWGFDTNYYNYSSYSFTGEKVATIVTNQGMGIKGDGMIITKITVQ